MAYFAVAVVQLAGKLVQLPVKIPSSPATYLGGAPGHARAATIVCIVPRKAVAS